MPAPKFDLNQVISTIGELFRKHGYHGTTLSIIKEASGLGKGSLYHHFANGKEDLGRRVLDDVQAWFEENVYRPLENDSPSPRSIENMFRKTSEFFRRGERVCVPGSFALYDARDSFPDRIKHYFERWIASLAQNLHKQGIPKRESEKLARDVVVSIQGALVIARALDNAKVFQEVLDRQKKMLLEKLSNQ